MLKSFRAVILALLAAMIAATLLHHPSAHGQPEADPWLIIKRAVPSIAKDLGRAIPDGTERSGPAAARFDAGSELSLPGGTDAEALSSTTTGATLYSDGTNGGVTTAVVQRDNGSSVQILTIIDDGQDPTAYAYGLIGVSLKHTVNGLVLTSSTGMMWRLAPAWARDAAGKPVPTRYELRDGMLVQIVDHVGDYTYPIVADPFWGQDLFHNLYQDSYNGDVRYNGDLTSWGWAVYAGGAVPGGLPVSQAIFKNEGWAEWVAKFPAITNKPTLWHQYQCHALGALAAGQWNLERFRRNEADRWSDWFEQRCNW